ncbi:MAG TPA: MmcQ-like protein [Cytophagales bacterium]|nr:MmcQ-like protein [Cytophagales bacterium]HAA17892.1 MmcQ-like protein [Cytophagales bacterium]HAP58186.1 MmcQ-like protein [Cytophagales bacterium]
MDIESYREYCIAKPGVTEELPFGPDTLVFKVLGKMFAATGIESFESVNLKCDPEEAVRLREEFPAIIPGYHMNKKHWNTVLMDGTLPDAFIRELIDKSYFLVIKSLTKKQKAELEELSRD